MLPPRQEPGQLDLETSALTMRPLHLHYSINKPRSPPIFPSAPNCKCQQFIKFNPLIQNDYEYHVEFLKQLKMLFTFYKYLHSIPSLEFLHSVHGYFLEPCNNEKSHKLYDKLKFTCTSEPVIIKRLVCFLHPLRHSPVSLHFVSFSSYR